MFFLLAVMMIRHLRATFACLALRWARQSLCCRSSYLFLFLVQKLPPAPILYFARARVSLCLQPRRRKLLIWTVVRRRHATGKSLK